MRPTVRITQGGSGTSRLEKALARVAHRDVLVGVPTSENERPDEMTNAALAYIHDNGSPLAGIPQREFLRPGIRTAEDRIARRLGAAAKVLLQENPEKADHQLQAAGMIARNAVVRKINKGPFTPNAPATVKRKGSSQPLIDTGNLRKSITFVIRDDK